MSRIHPTQLRELARAVERACAEHGMELWAQTPYLHEGSLCAALWSGPGPGERVVTHVGVTPYGTATVSGTDVVAVHSDLLGLILTEDERVPG